ncbi:DUF6671 family protein [Nostoc parmelioides]|uniref:DUF6671 domain-containing protein n=1 Tax=Nostoc parmelioides FACHB-3921 TaxID=2692909 RepID=A0ABR8BHH9_9NOSO|nr:DUF6671 family protein [Nostoc parmelioides]MBD2252413.1 hypothetical protein [Nostoc parmelioides FACHB-3921]
MNYQQLFSDRLAVLATMHHKEKVIAPLLEQDLGVKVIVPPDFNTDIFGTFTREVKRPGTQISAARLKAEKALEFTGESLAIASEGSFAPHPLVPYIYSNREIIILLDKINDIEIIGEYFSTDTNFNHQVVESLDEAYTFAKKVGFPEHGLVVWFENLDKKCHDMIKGITQETALIEAINFGLEKSPNSKINIETDMRAIYNPTRMKNIEKATHNLLQKISSCCPQCHTPGFEITERIKGLPCELCHMPTTLTLRAIYQCKKCGFRQDKPFPNGTEFADPSQCMYCNP